MFMKNIFSRKTFVSLILACYMISSFYFYILERNFKPLITIFLVVLSFFSAFYTSLNTRDLFDKKDKVIMWVIIYCFIVLLGSLNNTFSIDSIYFLAAPCFAYFISKNEFNLKILYVTLIYIDVVLLKFVLFDSGEELNFVFESASRNVFSVIAITNTALIYLVSIKEKKKIFMWPTIITLIISFLAMGRSGIITSLFLFIGVVYLYIKYKSLRYRLFFSLVFLTPIIFLVILNFSNLLLLINNFEAFQHLLQDGFESAERSQVLMSYIDNINFLNFFTGFDYSDVFIFEHLSMNPHNSYIRFHYYTGLLSIIILLKGFKVLYSYYKSSTLVFFIFSTLLLRGWSDSVFFFSFYDYLLFLLIFFSNIFTKKNAEIHL